MTFYPIEVRGGYDLTQSPSNMRLSILVDSRRHWRCDPNTGQSIGTMAAARELNAKVSRVVGCGAWKAHKPPLSVLNTSHQKEKILLGLYNFYIISSHVRYQDTRPRGGESFFLMLHSC